MLLCPFRLFTCWRYHLIISRPAHQFRDTNAVCFGKSFSVLFVFWLLLLSAQTERWWRRTLHMPGKKQRKLCWSGSWSRGVGKRVGGRSSGGHCSRVSYRRLTSMHRWLLFGTTDTKQRRENVEIHCAGAVKACPWLRDWNNHSPSLLWAGQF